MSVLVKNVSRIMVRTLMQMNSRMLCNNTCCTNSKNHTVCFGDYNFTDQVNLTTPEQWELGVRWSYTVLVLMVGFFGNLAIIIILARNRLLLRTSVNHFILNMSVADLLTSLAGPVPFTIRATHELWILGEVWCHLEGYIQMLVMLVSVTSLAVISFDRMLGVVRPFHQHLKKRQSIAIILVIWMASALLAVPFAIYRIYMERVWADMVETTCGEEGQKIRVWWVVIIIGLNWLPLIIIVTCYTTIFVYFKVDAFKLHNKREHPGMVHLKRRVVRMMFIVVMAFIICWLPFQILMLGKKRFLDSDGGFADNQKEQGYHILFSVAHYMIYTNAAVNPVIYAFMHQNFRRAFRITFPWIFKRKSGLVLRPGQGMQRYVWSMRANAFNVYGNDVAAPKRSLKDRLKGTSELTPSALLSLSAVAASIVLEPGTKDRDKRTQKEEKSKSFASSSISDEFEGNETIRKLSEGDISSCCIKVKKKKLKDKNESTDHAFLDSQRGVADTMIEERNLNDVRRPSYINEGFVRDLLPRRFSLRSTGALGDLIKQVIVEETSTEVDSERIL